MIEVDKRNRNQLLGNAMLFGCAIIWGFALVFQRTASETLGAFAFDGLRFFLATAVLLVTYAVSEFVNKKKKKTSTGWNKSTLLGGVLCGISIFWGNNLQQLGVAQTSVGKASFITAVYIVIVPMLCLLLRKKPKILNCYSIFIALVGFYLMCISGQVSINRGDLTVLASTFMISLQIVFIDLFIDECDPVKLTLIQFLTASVLSLPAMAIEGMPTAHAINVNIVSVLYVGVLSAGLAFTLQTIGQKYVPPSTTTLIMSLEAVFGMIGGAIFLHENYTVRELCGCLLVLVAVILAQTSAPQKLLKPNRSKFFIE